MGQGCGSGGKETFAGDEIKAQYNYFNGRAIRKLGAAFEFSSSLCAGAYFILQVICSEQVKKTALGGLKRKSFQNN